MVHNLGLHMSFEFWEGTSLSFVTQENDHRLTKSKQLLAKLLLVSRSLEEYARRCSRVQYHVDQSRRFSDRGIVKIVQERRKH